MCMSCKNNPTRMSLHINSGNAVSAKSVTGVNVSLGRITEL